MPAGGRTMFEMKSVIRICALSLSLVIAGSACSVKIDDPSSTTSAPSTSAIDDGSEGGLPVVPTPDDDAAALPGTAAAWGERYCALADGWISGLDAAVADGRARFEAAGSVQEQADVVREYYGTVADITDELKAGLAEIGPPEGPDGVSWLQDIQLQLGRISIAASQVAVDVAIGTFGPDTDLEDAINSAISGFEGDVSALEKSLRDPTTYYLDVAYGREIQSC